MPRLQYGRSAYRRLNGDPPELRLVNMLMEKSPTEEDGEILLGRAGLVTHSSPGTGTNGVAGMFNNDGLYAGAIFSVVDGRLIETVTDQGAISGTGPVSFATDGINEILVNAGEDIHRYVGGSLSTVTFPDTAAVRRVAYVGGYFIAIREFSDQFYWSAVADGSSWNALDYATAESSADRLRDVVVVGDMLWLCGTATMEPWAYTGDTDLPFRRIEGRSYQRGVYGTGCIVPINGALFWVGDDARVYTDGLQVIGDQGLAEYIRESSSVSCFTFTYEGHPIFCIRLDEHTFGYDVTTGSWVEFTSYQRGNWRVKSALTNGETVYLGDDELPRIWTFGGTDEDGDPIEHYWPAFIPVRGRPLFVDNIEVHANVGRATDASEEAEPFIEMRISRDEGKSWSNWRPVSMGRQGKYRNRVRWNRCGLVDSPGALFQWRMTHASQVRVSDITMNENAGGRGR